MKGRFSRVEFFRDVMGRISRLGKNTAYVFLGKIGSSIIGFLMLPLYTKWLGVEAFGLSDMISVYSSFLVILFTCCISESIFIFPKDKDKNIQTSFFSSAIVFLCGMFILAALVFALIHLLAEYFQKSNSFTDNLWLIYCLFVTSAIQQFFQQFTRSIDKMLAFSITGIVYACSTAILGFLLVPLLGISGYVLSLSLAALLSGVFSFVYSRSYEYLDYHSTAKGLTASMLRYSVPLMPNGLMWWLVNSLNRPLMEQHLGMHEIGIYAVANKFPALLTIIFGIFATSWQISVIEEFGKDGYKEFYNKVFNLIFTLLIVVLLGITITSKLIVKLFASPEFFDAWHYIPILTVGALFSNVSSFCGTNFSATRESKYFFYSSVWGALVSILFNLLLIPLWGTYGVCIAFVLSFAAMALFRLYYSWKYAKIENAWKYIIIFISVLVIISLYIINVPIYYIILMMTMFLLSLFFLNRQGLVAFVEIIKNKITKK